MALQIWHCKYGIAYMALQKMGFQKITNAQIGIAKEGIAKTAFKNGILIMAL
jgi:hypothetical protein